MSGPTVLILEPESSGTDLIPAAVELGFQVHVADRRPPELLPPAVRAAVADGTAVHLRTDTRSARAVTEAAVSLADRHPIAAVLPGFEYAVPVAAAVAQKLGLPGISPESAELLRDKVKMKQALAQAAVPVADGVPLSALHADDETVLRALRHIGLPAVVKPVDGCGSLRVRRIDDPADLLDYVRLSRSDPIDDMGLAIGGQLLLERYTAGPEVSVEGYVADGRIRIVAVTEKQLGPEPYFVETGHIVDAALRPEVRADIENITRTAVRALGVTTGAFHLEARVTPGGPVVMEVAARLGGDRIQQLVALAHGIGIPQAMIRCAAGLPLPDPTANGRPRVAGVRFFTVPEPALLEDPRELERRVRDVAGCVEASVSHREPARVMPAEDFRDRFGHAVLVAADRAGLDAAFAQVDRHVATCVRSSDPCTS